MRPLALGILFFCFGQVSAEQLCDTSAFPLSAPTERFEDNNDGTVTDIASRLMWMRCSIGQTWSQGQCAGDASRHTRTSADAQAESLNQGGTQFYNDWRVPTLRELASITERQCTNPRINLEIFPGTPSGRYWTASPVVGPEAASHAYSIGFGTEGVARSSTEEEHYVRLVRFDQ
ncbi:MAG: DUF1566 domain-containing protein [Thiocapsa sp.]|jgi:hypothetical protein|nr:DUF1566 domain-containing protein [Thiocapsa sp.]MCG6895837.1 DUF1566 domain-containing protein [Thiocapsa sp.]MCG6985220.1 DUF1566 domain-containing protein [Thiocapsa sp.]